MNKKLHYFQLKNFTVDWYIQNIKYVINDDWLEYNVWIISVIKIAKLGVMQYKKIRFTQIT